MSVAITLRDRQTLFETILKQTSLFIWKNFRWGTWQVSELFSLLTQSISRYIKMILERGVRIRWSEEKEICCSINEYLTFI